MSLLDSIKQRIGGAVSSATHAVEEAEATVEHAASAVTHAADEYAGVIKDKATALLKPTPPAQRTMYSGVTDAFKHTTTQLAGAVASTVHGVEGQLHATAEALSGAGRAVEHAGREVVAAGQRVLEAGAMSLGDVGRLAADAGHLVRDAGQVVTGAGKAAWHAGQAALSADPSQLEAARRSIAQAHAALCDAHATLADAHRQVDALGAQGEGVSAALGNARKAILDARASVGDAGRAVTSAIGAVVSAPRQLLSGVKQALSTGGEELRTAIATDVPGGKQLLAGLDQYEAGAQRTTLALLHLDVGGLASGVREEARGLITFGEGVAASPVGQYARHAIIDYANGFNVDKQVRELKAGETYTIKVGGDVHVAIGGEAKGSLSVKKNDDGTFTLDAIAAAGVNGYLSPEQVGKEGASASARLLLGGNGEFTFKSPEDVQRAVHIFEKTAALAASSASVAGPVTSLLLPAPAADELAFLGKHCTGVELNGKLAADGGLGLGLPGFEDKLGASLGIGLSQAASVKVELKDGVPVGLELKTELSGNLGGGVGVKLPRMPTAEGEKAASPYISLMLQGNATATASISTHYDLPKGMSLESLVAHPSTVLSGLARSGETPTTTIKTTVQGDGSIGLPGMKLGKANATGELTITGQQGDVLDPAVIAKAMRGDLEGAVQQASRRAVVQGNVHTVDKQTWGVEDFALTIADVGGKVTFNAEKSHQNPNELEFSVKDGVTTVKLAPDAQRLADEAKALALKTRAVLRG